MSRLTDLIGQKFGGLTVVDYKGKSHWLCKCNCGNTTNVVANSLRQGITKSCGCFKKEMAKKVRKPKDLKGKRIGRLTVLECVGKKNHKTIYFWKCKCTCGEIIEVRSDNLTFGKTKSCGCLHKDKVIKHGFWNTEYDKGTMKFYKMWQSLKARCDNLNLKCYKNYGGRGITYDLRWADFECFKEDMYFKYLYAVRQQKLKNASIERLDVNGNYCFENCTFIERTDQLKNTRSVHSFIAISSEGEKFSAKNVNEFCDKHGLNSSSVYACLKGKARQHKGWIFKKVE